MNTNAPAIGLYEWRTLSSMARREALRRPATQESAIIETQARAILTQVRADGDAALRELTRRYDGVALDALEASADERTRARAALSAVQLDAIERAIEQVRRFHAAQRLAPLALETAPGVLCERIVRPIERVGLYVPAGTAPLPSTAIMLAVPAALAGCPLRVLCTPPRRDGAVDAAVLTAATLCGVERVFKIGGAQAIAALAYGTESVPKVDKIYGPGNPWVTTAKVLVAGDPQGAALDLPAGPSEVLVIADAAADPRFVAADLLAQAEHSADAQAVLVSPSSALIAAALEAVESQCARLVRADIVRRALSHARAILVADLETAFEVANAYAPEHLILEIETPREWLDRVANAGSVFLGRWTPETMGDYCSGTNHVLPTHGFARAYSGLGLADYCKRITVQELSASGLAALRPTAVTLAQLEGLDAHAHAVSVRLQALSAGEGT